MEDTRTASLGVPWLFQGRRSRKRHPHAFRDDGGVHSKTWGSGKEDESDDYVFWPPQK